MKKQLLVMFLIIVLILQTSPVVTVSAEENDKNEELFTSSTDNSYEEYLNRYGKLNYDIAGTDISCDSEIINLKQNGCFEWEFESVADGFYSLSFDYRSCNDGGTSAYVIDINLDDTVPFSELNDYTIPRYWKSGEIKQGANGNDLRPEVTLSDDWNKLIIKDNEGLQAEPFAFYLSKGKHRLKLLCKESSFEIKNISFQGIEKLLDYSEYIKSKTEVYQGDNLPITEAEKYVTTNSLFVNLYSDVSSPLTTPYALNSIKLNTIGGSNWKYAGEKVLWEIDAPSSGLYAITFRYKQNFQTGLNSYRSIYVNGKIPFKEAAVLPFKYGDSWDYYTPDWSIYLNEGKNTIELETTIGELSNLFVKTNDVVADLNTLYRKIVMITGTVPDVNRDYDLTGEIPELKNTLLSLKRTIDGLIIEAKENVDGSGQLYVLNDMSRQLTDMAENPRSITKSGRLDRFKSNISSLASFAMVLREHPLLLDSFVLSSPNKPYKGKSLTFFQNIKHKINRLIYSFVADYSAVKTNDENQNIVVWINTGRDQLKILEDLIDNDFMAKSNVIVRLQLVNGSLIQAILAGKGPDVQLGLSESDVINYAMRGALDSLDKYKETEEMKSWFTKDSMEPLKYENKIYAIPETQSFYMMFVRTDILNELHLNIPKTWNEFTDKIFTILQRNNLTVGVGNLNNGGTISGIFPILLAQNGGSIYSENLLSADLTSPQALEAFSMAVSLYKDYGLPKEYDFMNRFRTGEMPIAIAPYINYNLLQVGAPEINGLWEMFPIPGILQNDGTINNTQFMTGTACAIINNSKNKNAACDFIYWWTSADIQRRFGLQQESILGASGRYAAANIEALKGLSWNNSQLETLEAQKNNNICLTHIPGDYYTGKAINNALVIAVTEGDVIAGEELIKWDELIDNELLRKQKEFGFNGRKAG